MVGTVLIIPFCDVENLRFNQQTDIGFSEKRCSYTVTGYKNSVGPRSLSLLCTERIVHSDLQKDISLLDQRMNPTFRHVLPPVHVFGYFWHPMHPLVVVVDKFAPDEVRQNADALNLDDDVIAFLQK